MGGNSIDTTRLVMVARNLGATLHQGSGPRARWAYEIGVFSSPEIYDSQEAAALGMLLMLIETCDNVTRSIVRHYLAGGLR